MNQKESKIGRKPLYYYSGVSNSVLKTSERVLGKEARQDYLERQKAMIEIAKLMQKVKKHSEFSGIRVIV